MASWEDARVAKDAVRELLDGRPEVRGIGLDCKESENGVDFGVRVDLNAEPTEPIPTEWVGVRIVARHVEAPVNALTGTHS